MSELNETITTKSVNNDVDNEEENHTDNDDVEDRNTSGMVDPPTTLTSFDHSIAPQQRPCPQPQLQ